MKIYENGKLVKVICNQCGKEHAVKLEIIQPDFLHVEKVWGFFSDKDGECHSFDICEECYDRLLEGFCIPAQKEEQTELI